MCNRPDFEEMEQDMDKTLLSLLRQWHDFLKCLLEDDELQKIDCVEEFCKDIRQRLIALKDTPDMQKILDKGA